MENKISGEIFTEVNGTKNNFAYEYCQYFDQTFKRLGYRFDIWEKEREDELRFSFILIVTDNLFDLKCIDMYALNEAYKGKGISRAVILEARKVFKKRIISSSNQRRIDPHEQRREDGSKVWMKMKVAGLAGYNEEGDYFFTI